MAVRAEMGRLPLPALPPGRQGQSPLEIGRRSDPLLSRTGRGRARTESGGVSARRRNRGAARQEILVRRFIAADSSRREPDRRNCRGKRRRFILPSISWRPRRTESFRRNRWASGVRRWRPLQGISSKPIQRFDCHRQRQVTRPQQNGLHRPAEAMTGSSPSASICPINPAAATACRRSRISAAPTA